MSGSDEEDAAVGYVEPELKPTDRPANKPLTQLEGDDASDQHAYPRAAHGEWAHELEDVVSSPPLDGKHLAADAAQHFGWREETPMAAALDPETQGWTRRYDDPNVVARREELKANAGIPDLPVIDGKKCAAGDAAEIARAVEVFERDGFCAMSDALNPEQLAFMQGGVDRTMAEEFIADDPHMGGRYTGRWGLEPGRYSFGSVRQLHKKEWCMLIDLPTTTPVLRAMFKSADQDDDYYCWGAGGDVSLAGSVEYQCDPQLCSVLCTFFSSGSV